MTDTLLVVFTGVLALAALTQCAVLIAALLNLQKLTKDLLPQIQKLIEKTDAVFTDIGDITEGIKPAAHKLASSAEIIHSRVVDVDGFVGEVVEKSRREIAEIGDTVHNVTRRTLDAIDLLNENVLMPVNRINAFAKAVRVGVGVLFRRRKNSNRSVAKRSGV